MIAARNIGLWFLSVLISVSLFSLVYAVPENWPLKAWLFVFRITMMGALPVACLYLPVVITQPDAGDGRMRVIAGSGIVIGPAYVVLLGLIAGIRGQPDVIEGSPPGFGIVTGIILAFIVGSLTTILYISALKLVHHLTSASKPVSIH
jgi:hypothetical protein